MFSRRITAIVLSLVMSTMLLIGCENSELTEDETQKEAIEKIIAGFEKLTQIPRPSGQEKEVSDYLYAWAKEAGQNAKQDEVNNVIVDVPATAGCEDRPLTVLQCHMDMVAVAEDGYVYDPLKDPVRLVRTDTELKAEHTSLGGDDGIGVAIVQYIAENNEKHGPLRILITTDEEVTQTGAKGLDPATLADAEYLINIDWECSDEVGVTSGSSLYETFRKDAEWVENPWNNPVELRVSGGLGGHSGQEINNGIANANIVLADLLVALKNAEVRYCLASMEGGSAENAITSDAKAVITVHENDGQKLTEEIARFNENLSAKYKETDPEIRVEELYPNLLVQMVLSERERDNVLALLTNLVSGVYTMSQKADNFVEASANVGIVKIAEDGCNIRSMIRSSENYPEEHIAGAQVMLAEALGFTAETERGCYAWAYDPDNDLQKMAADVYLAQNGEEIKETFTHAGLECGVFRKYNSELKMISIGPDILDAHTVRETVKIDSIGRTLALIEGILAEIAR